MKIRVGKDKFGRLCTDIKEYNLSNESELRDLMTSYYKKEMKDIEIHYMESVKHESQPQLTKREQFAMAAMQGIVSCDPDGQITPDKCATYATNYADALLKELEK